MKKIFSILAVAAIALSFASCEKGGTVNMNGYKITVDSITETSAFIAIEPADTATWYGVALYETSTVVKYSADTLVAYQIEELQYYIDNYSQTLQSLSQWGYCFMGAMESAVNDLPVNTDLTVIVYTINEEDGALSAGKYAIIAFKTKDIAIAGRESIEVEGEFEDVIEEDGYIWFGGYSKDSACYISFYADVDSLNEPLNKDNFDFQYSSFYTFPEDTTYLQWGIASANLRPSYNEGTEVLSVDGKFVATNGIEYTMTFHGTAEEESAGAPARKVAKKVNTTKELKPVKLGLSKK